MTDADFDVVAGRADEARCSAICAACGSLNEPTWITQVPRLGVLSLGTGTAAVAGTVVGVAGAGATKPAYFGVTAGFWVVGASALATVAGGR